MKEKKEQKILKKIYYYFERSRPGGWLVSVVFLLLGEWYAFNNFTFLDTLFASFSLVGIAIAGSWVNFVYDKELDEFAGKDVDLFKKNILPNEMLFFSVVLTIFCCLLLLSLNIYVFMLGLLLALLYFFYSIPPVRLKTKPPLDSLVNAFVFGTIPFFMGWTIKLESLNNLSLFIGFIVSMVIIIYYLILSSLDIQKDKEYGIKTSCTILGFKNSINISFVFFIVLLFLSYIVLGLFSIFTLAFLFITPFIFIIFIKKNYQALRILLSIIYYLLTEITLFILYLRSESKIPLVLFLIILFIGIYATSVFLYLKRKNTLTR